MKKTKPTKLEQLQNKFFRAHEALADLLSDLPRWRDECDCKELNIGYILMLDEDEKAFHVCPVCGGDVDSRIRSGK